MSWIKINAVDLEEILNKPQIDILKARTFSSKGGDPASRAIESAVARVRMEVSASGLNALDIDHSRVPQELKEVALRLAVESLMIRIPAMEISASQQRAADEAREILRRVASGELPISRPAISVSSASAKKGISHKASKKIAGRDKLKGLI